MRERERERGRERPTFKPNRELPGLSWPMGNTNRQGRMG